MPSGCKVASVELLGYSRQERSSWRARGITCETAFGGSSHALSQMQRCCLELPKQVSRTSIGQPSQHCHMWPSPRLCLRSIQTQTNPEILPSTCNTTDLRLAASPTASIALADEKGELCVHAINMARTQGTSWQSSTGRNLGFTPYDNLKRRKYTYQRTTSDLVSNQNGSQENEDDDNEWDSEDPRSRSDESALPPKVKSLVVQPILDIQKIENFCCSSEQLFKEHKEWFNQLSPNHSADNMIFLEIQRAFSEDDPESDTQYSENEMALVEWPTYKGLQGGLPTIGLRMFDMKVPPYYVPHYPTWFRQIEMTRIREYDPEFTGEVVTRWPRRGKEGFEEAQFLASKQLYKVIRTAMRLIHARYKIRGMKTLRAQDHRPFSQNQGEPRCICNQPIRRYGGEQEGVERCIDPQCKVGRYHYKCLSENELNNVVTYDCKSAH